MLNKTHIYTLEEAVNSAYSNSALRKHFYEREAKSKKGKGNLGANQTKQLLLNLDIDWTDVKISGKGADRIISCSGKREQSIRKKDNRKDNGKGQILYESVVRDLVVIHLKQNNKTFSNTISSFAHNLELTSNTLYYASKVKVSTEQKKHYDNLLSKYKIGYSMFWHIVSKESKRIHDNLNSILKRMSEENIIRYKTFLNAVTMNANREHYALDIKIADEIKTKMNELREKHDVLIVDILFKPNKYKVLQYRREEQTYLNSIGIMYVYETKKIDLISDGYEVKDDMKSSFINEFKVKHVEIVKNLAERIQDNFNSKLIKPKDNSKLLLELGGKKKPEHAIFKGTEYQLVMENSTRLLYDRLAQAKVAGTFPTEYSVNLRIIQDINYD
ncbi:hypothetical protein [Alkalicoccobacillus murimartini]|uniref:Uncharacterized protein n=1 Tax=Alkalicoccobacillus murimartini TaxID=171685 RepID=A0ABT9YCM8_9BACI|nr:hypothetical protein [Alkalicoccobacillus murimartini]MDQ0205230.1 hypothetical protein [Alkalicoccobacillus murimartini]